MSEKNQLSLGLAILEILGTRTRKETPIGIKADTCCAIAGEISDTGTGRVYLAVFHSCCRLPTH